MNVKLWLYYSVQGPSLLPTVPLNKKVDDQVDVEMWLICDRGSIIKLKIASLHTK